jgi:hypothetical protein
MTKSAVVAILAVISMFLVSGVSIARSVKAPDVTPIPLEVDNHIGGDLYDSCKDICALKDCEKEDDIRSCMEYDELCTFAIKQCEIIKSLNHS